MVLLAYPALAFFSTPVILFYCGALLITSTNIRELWWKLGVSGLLLTVMLATHIPLFFKNLYSYTYGAYFSDLVANTDDRLIIWKNATVLGVFWPDPKVLLLCFVAAVSAVFFAVRGSGAIRRFAIAMLAGEAGVFATGGIIAYLHYPVSLYYSDQLQAPIAVLFFVMPLIFAAGVLGRGFDKALDSFLAQAVKDGKLAPAFSNRRRWYAAAAIVVLAISPLLVPRERPFDNSIYPPAKPPSVQILQNELGLAPGKPFAGRALTLVRQDLPAAATAGTDMNPLLIAVLDVLENHYGRFTGNDHWNDLLNLNIPVFGQYAQWVTPIDFLLLHTFFARKEDVFQKSVFILRAYNERIAQMIGIRYVVTDAANIPGGIMVYQQMAGDTPLRLFRIDGTNLGQYSPTTSDPHHDGRRRSGGSQKRPVRSAAECARRAGCARRSRSRATAIADGRKRAGLHVTSDIVRDKPSGPTVRIQPLPSAERERAARRASSPSICSRPAYCLTARRCRNRLSLRAIG